MSQVFKILEEQLSVDSLKELDKYLKNLLLKELSSQFFIAYHLKFKPAFFYFTSSGGFFINESSDSLLYEILKKGGPIDDEGLIKFFFKKNLLDQIFSYPFNVRNNCLISLVVTGELSKSQKVILGFIVKIIENFFSNYQKKIDHEILKNLMSFLNKGSPRELFSSLSFLKEQVKKKIDYQELAWVLKCGKNNYPLIRGRLDKGSTAPNSLNVIDFYSIKKKDGLFLEEFSLPNSKIDGFNPRASLIFFSQKGTHLILVIQKKVKDFFSDEEIYFLDSLKKNWEFFFKKGNYFFPLNESIFIKGNKKIINLQIQHSFPNKPLFFSQKKSSIDGNTLEKIIYFDVLKDADEKKVYFHKKLIDLVFKKENNNEVGLKTLESYLNDKIFSFESVRSFFIMDFYSSNETLELIKTANFPCYYFNFKKGDWQEGSLKDLSIGLGKFKINAQKITLSNVGHQDLLLLFSNPLSKGSLKKLKEVLILCSHLTNEVIFKKVTQKFVNKNCFFLTQQFKNNLVYDRNTI